MKRRQFLQASAAATCLGGAAALAQEGGQPARDYIELRTYRVGDIEQQRGVIEHLRRAALPAWGRLGIEPVGVFTETGDEAGPHVHVLIPYRSPEQFAGARAALEADARYQDAARAYRNAPKDTPAFERIESSLLVAFAGMPQLSPPEVGAGSYELRTYESHSEAKARRKIEMFNDGEIPIFSDAGFHPVFFGETLIGQRLPNLKYMLATPDMEANAAAWRSFVEHPDWVAMRDLPKYADTVSAITRVYLAPTDFSAI